jgi:hypothetical protein
MKKLSQVIPSMQNFSDCEKRPASSKRAEKVWTALAEMFGNTFFMQFGESPPSVWLAQIEQLTDNDVRRGLKNIAESDSRFAPNLSQFVAACKRLPPVRQLGVPAVEDKRPRGNMSYSDWMKRQREGQDDL